MASILDPYAMAIDTSQPDDDERTVRSWAADRLQGARPFMLPQMRPFLVVPCRTFEDALRLTYRFPKAGFAREMPWKSETTLRRERGGRNASG